MAGSVPDFRPRRSFVAGLPVWLKACVVKWWFAGSVFYFVGWGLFIQSADQLDLTFVMGLALGAVTDLLVNRALVFFENDRTNYRRYLLCYSRRFFSVPVNLVYGIALSAAVSYTYHAINITAQHITGQPPGTVLLGAEPILYGLFVLGYDMLAIMLKNAVKGLVRKARGHLNQK